MIKMDPELNVAGYRLPKIVGVRCPECGYGGGSPYSCWCTDCYKYGEFVLMLPSINGRIIGNWAEVKKGA